MRISTELALSIENCTTAPNSLTFHRELSFEEWRSVGEKLLGCDSAMKWLVGDWINYGKEKHSRRYSEALALFCGEGGPGYDENTIYRWGRVAAIYSDFSLRRLNLSWSHHFLLADKDILPKVREKLLDQASEENWSYERLKEELRKRFIDKNATVENPDADKDITAAFHPITVYFNQNKDFKTWAPERLMAVRGYLSKAVDYQSQIEMEIKRRGL